MSRKTVRAVMQRPAPAESPAKTILEGGIGLCKASGGGSVRKKSGECVKNHFLGLHDAHTCSKYILERTWPGILGRLPSKVSVIPSRACMLKCAYR